MPNVMKNRAILAMKRNKRNGQEYFQFTGWVNGEKTSIAISISCDENGAIQRYEGKNGDQLIYANVNIMPASTKRNNKNF